MMPAPASAARAEPARPPAAEALLRQYAGWLAARGRGNRCFADGAAGFLRRWPDPQSFAAEPLDAMLSQDQQTRPFITFLLLHDLLRPGYEYLAERKFASLLDLARGTRLEPDLDGYQRAAAELGFSPHVCSRSAERVIIRLLIQAGRRLHDLAVADLHDAEAAFRARGERRNGDWSSDRGFLHAARTVLFHLGIIEVTPPNRHRHEHAGHAHHFGGVPAWLAARLEDYTSAISGTHEPSTMDGIAIRLAHFGRHLAATDPGLDSLAGLDRQRHIETYLAATAVARAARGGQPISAGEQRSRIITLGRFLADIAEWQWPDAPARRLVFTRDIPKLPRALPRYLPADADRLIGEALQVSPNRLFADALLLTRATGLRIGELIDLELNCVHEVPGTGAWLKVPLGKLDSERMVPLDDEAVALIDRIAETRSPGKPLPNPKTGQPAEFLLTHFGKRVSAQALRDELARACQAAGLPPATPHQLRHTCSNRADQRRLLAAGTDGHARTRLRRDEPALRAAIRQHCPRRLRTRPRPSQNDAHGPLAGRAGNAAGHRHHQRERRLEGHPADQVTARRRLLPAHRRPGQLRLRQHLRALPQLPHRCRLLARPGRPARRHPGAPRRRRSPRLGRRSRPPPAAARTARPAHGPD